MDVMTHTAVSPEELEVFYKGLKHGNNISKICEDLNIRLGQGQARAIRLQLEDVFGIAEIKRLENLNANQEPLCFLRSSIVSRITVSNIKSVNRMIYFLEYCMKLALKRKQEMLDGTEANKVPRDTEVTEEQLKELIFSKLLLDMPSDIDSTADLEVYGIDSFFLLQVEFIIEDEYDIKIESEDQGTLRSISAICKFLNKELKC